MGSQVDYKSLINSQVFQNDFLKSIAELKHIKLDRLINDEQKLAFFINILLNFVLKNYLKKPKL
jgi:hypothetical protein